MSLSNCGLSSSVEVRGSVGSGVTSFDPLVFDLPFLLDASLFFDPPLAFNFIRNATSPCFETKLLFPIAEHCAKSSMNSLRDEFIVHSGQYCIVHFRFGMFRFETNFCQLLILLGFVRD